MCYSRISPSQGGYLSSDTPREQRQYFAYLLRVWQVSSAGQISWRASLEDAETGERIGFADLDALCAYLNKRTSGADSGGLGPIGGQSETDLAF